MSPKVLLILKGLLQSIRNWSSGSIWRKKLRCCSSGVGYRQGIRFLNAYFESLIKSHMCWTVAATTSLCSNVCGIRPWRAALNSCSVPSSPLQVCNVYSKAVPPWVCRGLNYPLCAFLNLNLPECFIYLAANWFDLKSLSLCFKCRHLLFWKG